MRRRQLNNINEIILHCSASPYAKHDDISVIEKWHREPERGFMPTPEGVYCGYHYYIKKDGTVQTGRPLHWFGQHCKGHNWKSIGVCLGGMGGKDITDKQFLAVTELIIDLKEEIQNINKVCQHSDYDKKKPHCAGLSNAHVEYLNNLVR